MKRTFLICILSPLHAMSMRAARGYQAIVKLMGANIRIMVQPTNKKAVKYLTIICIRIPLYAQSLYKQVYN